MTSCTRARPDNGLPGGRYMRQRVAGERYDRHLESMTYRKPDSVNEFTRI